MLDNVNLGKYFLQHQSIYYSSIIKEGLYFPLTLFCSLHPQSFQKQSMLLGTWLLSIPVYRSPWGQMERLGPCQTKHAKRRKRRGQIWILATFVLSKVGKWQWCIELYISISKYQAVLLFHFIATDSKPMQPVWLHVTCMILCNLM